jgi:hypothetical protein
VTDEDRLAQVLGVQDPQHVRDVRLQVDVPAREVRALPETGECDREDIAAE